jgi:uncharacterized protein
MNQRQFDFSIWERSHSRKIKEREELRHSVLSRLNGALEILSDQYSWTEVFIFGSVIRKGAFHENSDVDIGIQGLYPLRHYAFVGELSGLLERDVDVVLLEECGFADRIKEKGLKWSAKQK